MKGMIVGGIVLLLALLVGLIWILGLKAKARLTARFPPAGQMIDVGGYRLHIQCQGESRPGTPTVVLEAPNGRSWRLIPSISARRPRVTEGFASFGKPAGLQRCVDRRAANRLIRKGLTALLRVDFTWMI